MRPPLELVEELRSKYFEMLAMRLADMEAAGAPEYDAGVRARMAALAARFPGALREIDDLELDEIRGRLGTLDAVLIGAARVEPWMVAMALFHRLTRGALSAKAWLRGRKRIDAAIHGAYASEAHSLPFPEDALQWAGDLAQVASPPAGRVTHLVYARMARELQTTEREAKRLVFGLGRRAARRPP